MDRYTKAVLTVIAVALVVIAARPLLGDSTWMGAVRPDVAQAQTTTPKYEMTIPKSWGKVIAFSNNNLLMEAPDHIMRVVDVEGRAPEYPKVKALLRFE